MYPPLHLAVRTPRLTLAAATDDLLERLLPIVRAGLVADGSPTPFDDPSAFHEDTRPASGAGCGRSGAAGHGWIPTSGACTS